MKIAVVIPCYKVKEHIEAVIARIPEMVERIYVIDDKCPENSGKFVEENVKDFRVVVLYNPENYGVGGAVIRGFEAAIKDSAEVVVKIDGDGQMNPELLPKFVAPVAYGEADYAKGNRFFDINSVKKMPPIRIIGNAAVSFLSKISSGYWNVFDPTNGYFAISGNVLKKLPLHKISKRYFFESDMLFRLNLLHAKVIDIPMEAHYGSEKSGLVIRTNCLPFMGGYMKNFLKRIFYNYYLRDFSLASIELFLGLILLGFGVGFGAEMWIRSIDANVAATAGTVMLSALPVILGFQLILAFLNYDINSVPKIAISKYLKE